MRESSRSDWVLTLFRKLNDNYPYTWVVEAVGWSCFPFFQLQTVILVHHANKDTGGDERVRAPLFSSKSAPFHRRFVMHKGNASMASFSERWISLKDMNLCRLSSVSFAKKAACIRQLADVRYYCRHEGSTWTPVLGSWWSTIHVCMWLRYTFFFNLANSTFRCSGRQDNIVTSVLLWYYYDTMIEKGDRLLFK